MPLQTLRVESIAEQPHAITIAIDGSRFFFTATGANIALNGEAQASAAAVLAMQSQSVLQLDRPISDQYRHGLQHASAIFHQWFGFAPLARVEAPPASLATYARVGSRVGAFFSGGADSLYTLLQHREEITDLILVIGMDIPLSDTQQASVTEAAARRVATQFGKNLVVVQTNLRAAIERARLDWGSQAHGAVLATIGHLLSEDFRKIYIASSHTYQGLFPWGSHPVLDHHWSSERLQFVHDGCDATRVQKIQRISEDPIALPALRVCWMSSNGVYNCGVCSKCVRTMISLVAAKALDRATSFPNTLSPSSVRRLKLHKANDMLFATENIVALEQSGASPEILAALKQALGPSRFRAGVTALIALFPATERMLKAIHARFKPPPRPIELVAAAFDAPAPPQN